MRLLKLYFKYFIRRIAFAITSGLLISLFFVCKLPEIPFTSIENPFSIYFKELDSWLYIIHVLILIFLVLILFELVFTLFYSIFNSLLIRRKAFLHKHISDAIFKYLLGKHDEKEDKAIIRKLSFLIISDDAKRIFMSWLRKTVLLTRGNVYEHCLSFFGLFKNEKLLRAYLRSPYLNHKLFALTIIGDFKLKGFDKKIARQLRSRNKTLKSDAICAYIKTNVETDLVFLTKMPTKLSIWDFNVIVLLARDYKNIDYAQLLYSNDNAVKALGLRFINIHRVVGLKNDVIELIDHPQRLIKEEALLAFLTLASSEVDFETLIVKFDDLPPSLQYKTINVLGYYPNIKQVLIFFDWLIQHKSIEIKTHAMAKLFELNMAYVLKYKQHHNEVVRRVFSQLISINI